MATHDIRITMGNLDKTEQSSVEQFPSDAPRQASEQDIASELGYIIHEPKTKSLVVDLRQLCERSSGANACSIYKVPHRLRQVNEKAYEPKVISIGPYHHVKEHLKAREVIKRSWFGRMIQDSKLEPEIFVEAMKPMEKQIRECYEEPLDHIDSDTFVKMMILDGCFIVQLFDFQDNDNDRSEYPFNLNGLLTEVYYDLLLLENQLPFFVLSELYGMIKTSNGERDNKFTKLALSRLSKVIPGPEICPDEKCLISAKETKHLLGLVHDSWLPSPQGIKQHKDFRAKAAPTDRCLWKYICCATELKEAGIRFSKKNEKDLYSLFDIEFENAKLKIPTLSIYDGTERILSNFFAYEQFIPSSKPTYVCDYVAFMDKLVNTGEDVQLLCNCGVIDKWIGGDEAVAQMFNKLCDCLYLSNDNYYAEIFVKMDEHRQRKWKKWKATWRNWEAIVKRDYLTSPSSFISFLAAVVLLLFTSLQTLFSVLSYAYH